MTTEAKHTPGPWFHSYGPNADVRAGNSLTGRIICNTVGNTFAGRRTSKEAIAAKLDENRANAHLIAAAPDLLRLVELVHGSFSGGLVMTFSDEDVAEFEAAIAKARGA